MSVSITCSYAGNRPLQELNKVIQNRMDILLEDSRNATIATAIDCMSSLRVLTKKAKLGRVVIKRATDAKVGWKTGKGNSRHRVVRVGGRLVENASRTKWQKESFVISGKHPPQEDLKAFRWFPPKREIAQQRFNDPVIIAATSMSEARRKGKQLQKRRLRFGNIAKRAWGKLMRDSSTRNPPKLEKVDRRGIQVIDQYCTVHTFDKADGFGMQIHDGLSYAAMALKNGSASVGLALARAANKITGRLRQHYKRHSAYFFAAGKKCPEVPFPEIVKKRRK